MDTYSFIEQINSLEGIKIVIKTKRSRTIVCRKLNQGNPILASRANTPSYGLHQKHCFDQGPIVTEKGWQGHYLQLFIWYILVILLKCSMHVF